MFEKILVPLDGSPLAEKALAYAMFLAEPAGGRVLLVRAVEAWAATIHDTIEKEVAKRPKVAAEVAAVAKPLAKSGASVETQVHLGEPAGVIESTARVEGATIIVMSTHGRGGLARWAYGSVAERVLRSSTLPLLLIPAHSNLSWQAQDARTILVPLDGSSLAEEALGPAKLLAQALKASIHLLQVVEPPTMVLASPTLGYYQEFDLSKWADEARPYAERIVDDLRQAGFKATAETRVGYAAATIEEEAAHRGAAAIVMATHGRTGLARLALGSVTVGVVQRATVPVLIVRPVAMREPELAAPELSQATA